MAIDTRNKRAAAGSMAGMEILPLADGTVDYEEDAVQVAGFVPGTPTGGIAGFPTVPVFTRFAHHIRFYGGI